jgi:hypothetical protein
MIRLGISKTPLRLSLVYANRQYTSDVSYDNSSSIARFLLAETGGVTSEGASHYWINLPLVASHSLHRVCYNTPCFFVFVTLITMDSLSVHVSSFLIIVTLQSMFACH